MTAAVRVRGIASLSLALLLGSLLAVPAQAQAVAEATDTVATAKLLPPNVLLYVNIPNVNEFYERFSETGMGQMVHDPALADLRAEVMRKFEEASAEAEEEIGMPLSDVLTIPSGQVAFAMLQPPGQQLGVVMLMEVGDGQARLDELLEKAEAEIEEQGELTRSSDEFEGTEITVWTNENAGPNEPFKSLTYFVKDNTFVVGSGVELMEAVLVRWDGDHDRTFANDETFAYILDRCSPDGPDSTVASWYFNPLGLFKSGMQAAGPEVAMQSAMVMGFLPVLGFDRLKGMGGTLDFNTEEFDMVSHSVIYVKQPTTGVLRALECPVADLTPPKFVPATTSNINVVNWDVQGAYTAVQETWDFFTAPGTFDNMMDEAEESEEGPGIHPKQDFIDLLTGRIHLIQELPKDFNNPEQRMVFLFGVNDQQRMEEVLSR
ncbi:MAG: hypothetical protein R3B90_02625 [Planctomycetaceae bacterium]